jgi:regulator of protease activity HflC (stomatin/prohibitin superfamily)
MLFFITFAVTIMLLAASVVALFSYKRMWVVHEDTVAITVNQDGFVKRILGPGRHILHPFEKIEFTVETKTKLTSSQAISIATGDGIPVKINWSATYALQPEAITEQVSQRLRSLPNAEKAIARQADICLRRLIGDHTMQDLFRPATRERIERHLSQLLSERLHPLGIVVRSLYLQAIDLPQDVAEALNKAKAIETLDSTIRQLDPTTREVVRGVYQLDEILHWDAYLPTPSRLGMKRLQTATP